MKILNVTTITEWRGGDAQMYTIYNLLKNKKDLKQFILCPNDAILAKVCDKDEANYFTYFKNKFKLINCTKKIIRICKKEKIDLIHIHDSSALNAGLIAKIFLPKSTKLVLSRKRNNPIKDKFLNRFKYSHHYISKIISVSLAVQAIFDNIIKDKSRLLTIYDAIDVQKFSTKKSKNLLRQELNLSPETLIIGNIAALTDQKDIHTFINSAEKILHKNNNSLKIKFVVIGDGDLKKVLNEYITSKKLEDDIFLMGYKNNVSDLLPEFDLFLLTSITEGLPLTIYEAFASKIPVVATAAGGIAEVVINSKTGFIAALKDAETLSDGVLALLNDAVLKEKIVNNAFELVQKNHDLNVMEQNYYDFYKSF